MTTPTRPLCPHCLRQACPWLTMYSYLMGMRRLGSPPDPTPGSQCPHFEQPLPPRSRMVALEALYRGAAADPYHGIRGERAAFDLYRTAIETAARLNERITPEDLVVLDIEADAARVLAMGRKP